MFPSCPKQLFDAAFTVCIPGSLDGCPCGLDPRQRLPDLLVEPLVQDVAPPPEADEAHEAAAATLTAEALTIFNTIFFLIAKIKE